MKTKNKFKFLRKTKNTIKKSLIFLLFISFFIFSSNTNIKSEIITNKTIETVINENTKNYKTVIENYIKEKIKNNKRNINKIRFYLDIEITISDFIKNKDLFFYTINDKLIIKINLKNIFSVLYSNTYKTKKIKLFKIFLEETFRNKFRNENKTIEDKELNKWNWDNNFYFVFNKNKNYNLNEIIFTQKEIEKLENSNKILKIKTNNYLEVFDYKSFSKTRHFRQHFKKRFKEKNIKQYISITKNIYKKNKETKENKIEIKQITKETNQQTTENKKETKENKKETKTTEKNQQKITNQQTTENKTKENKKETKDNKNQTKESWFYKKIIIIVLSVLTFISLIFLCFYIKDKYKK